MLKKVICFLYIFSILGANVCFAVSYTEEEARLIEECLQNKVEDKIVFSEKYKEYERYILEPLTEKNITDDLKKYMEKKQITIEELNYEIQWQIQKIIDRHESKEYLEHKVQDFDMDTLEKEYFVEDEDIFLNYVKENNSFIKSLENVNKFESWDIKAVNKYGECLSLSLQKDEVGEMEVSIIVYGYDERFLTEIEAINIVKNYVKNKTGKDEEIKDIKNISFFMDSCGTDRFFCAILEDGKEYIIPYLGDPYYQTYEKGKVYTVRQMIDIIREYRKLSNQI